MSVPGQAIKAESVRVNESYLMQVGEDLLISWLTVIR